MKKIKGMVLNTGSLKLSFDNKENYMDIRKFLSIFVKLGKNPELEPCTFIVKFSDKTNELLVEDKAGVKPNQGINDVLKYFKLNNVEYPDLNNKMFETVPNEGESETDSLLRKKNQ